MILRHAAGCIFIGVALLFGFLARMLPRNEAPELHWSAFGCAFVGALMFLW